MIVRIWENAFQQNFKHLKYGNTNKETNTLIKMFAVPLLRILGSRWEYMTLIDLLLSGVKFSTSRARAAVIPHNRKNIKKVQNHISKPNPIERIRGRTRQLKHLADSVAQGRKFKMKNWKTGQIKQQHNQFKQLQERSLSIKIKKKKKARP